MTAAPRTTLGAAEETTTMTRPGNASWQRIAIAALGAATAVGFAAAQGDADPPPAPRTPRAESRLPAVPPPEAPLAPRAERRSVFVFDRGSGKPLVRFIGPEAPRGFLGVSLSALTPELRQHFGVPGDAGVMVSSVVAGSPADKAGVRVGDIISALDGDPIPDPGALQAAIFDRPDGDVAVLEIWRDRKRQQVNATLEVKARPRIDVGQFVLEFDENSPPPDVLRNFDFSTLPRELERLEIAPLAIDEARLKVALERFEQAKRAEGARTKAQLEAEEAQRRAIEERRRALEKRLEDLEKKIQEMEERARERSALGRETPALAPTPTPAP